MNDMNESINHSWSEKITNTRSYERLNTFLKSAAVALIFAVICFAFDRYENIKQQEQLNESIQKLDEIEKGLSTRSLGIFPGYIKEIRELFDDIEKTDEVVIMEDVLYYGFKSKPKEFYEMNKKLFDHALTDGSITIAYYNYESIEQTRGLVSKNIFHNMIKEELISYDYIVKMKKESDSIFKTLKGLNHKDLYLAIVQTEYELCEKYFQATCSNDFKKFSKKIDEYLNTDLINFGENESSQGALVAKEMCLEIQKIKEKYLKKDKKQISYSDLENMNRDISFLIAETYKKRGIKLVALNEYLTMSCWMVKHSTGMRAVLAFPSKYSSDEIGFYSQDEAFSKYISTMMEGILLNNRFKIE
jgi:hypothetical protein